MTDGLDEFDRRILRILQGDGKISMQDLAERVGLSTSPCWRRVRRLEEAGVIHKYAAVLDARALGLRALAYVHVCLLEHTEAAIATFDAFVQGQERIVECCSVTGSDDYMLRVVARDAEDLEQFLMKQLLGLGIVRSSTTNFVLRQKKYSTALPLE